MSRSRVRPLDRTRRSPRVLYRYPNTWAQTFGRSTIASYRKAGGVLAEAAPGELRDRHFVRNPEGVLVPSRLLEGGRKNELTRSKELDHGDWTKTRVSVTADQATGPDGATALDEIIEDSAATAERYVFQNQTLTADANYAFSCSFIANTRTLCYLRVREDGNATNRGVAWFDLSDGTVGTTADNGTGSFVRAHVMDYIDVASGLYRCVLVASVGNSATSITADVGLTDTDGQTAYTGDGSSSLYAGYAQLEDQANFDSSSIETTTAAFSRDADLLQDTFPVTLAEIEQMGGLTVLSEWVELGTTLTSVGRYWQIGGPSPTASPRFALIHPGTNTQVQALFDDGTTDARSLATPGLALFDHVRTRTVIFLDGSDWKIQLHVSVNGGAEVSYTADTIGTSLTAGGDDWSADTLTIGAADDTLHGYAAHIKHVFVGGVHSLAVMRGIAG